MNKIILVALLINLLIIVVTAQQIQDFELVSPTDCMVTEFFNIASLKCEKCPDSSSSKENKFNCKCNEDYFFTMNSGGGSITCAPCPTGAIQSADGFSCTYRESTCLPNSNSFQTDIEFNGEPRNSSCIECDTFSSISSGSSCISCRPYIYSDIPPEMVNCSSSFVRVLGGILFYNQTTFPSEPSTLPDSNWFHREYAASVYRLCYDENKRNETACQTLANICVLDLYNKDGSCGSYEKLSNVTQIDLGQSYQTFKQTYANRYPFYPLALRYSGSTCQTDRHRFISAEYGLRGNLIKIDEFDLSRLQLCNIITSYARLSKISPFTTSNVVQKCSIKPEILFELARDNPLIFYDLYIEYNSSSLIPVPITITRNQDIYSDGYPVYKRFFILESITSKNEITDEETSVRYAKSITIRFDLVPSKSNGEVYPPIVIIEYDTVKKEVSSEVEISFRIEYYQSDINSQMLIIYVALGVVAGLSLLWACLQMWSWSRRSDRATIDFIALFKLIMLLIGGSSSAVFYVVCGASIYWLIFYRSQTVAFIFLPIANQESIFGAFLFVAFGLKLLDVIYLIFVQTSYDIFFIDWERPKSEPTIINELNPIKNSQKDEKKKEKSAYETVYGENKVSCWRTLFVANEWNELQTYRKLNTTIQLIFVLLLLKIVNLEELTRRDCVKDLKPEPNEYSAPYSFILRLAMGSSIYMAVGLVQYILHIFYCGFIEDKLGQFIDFCSVANISMFVMTHSQYGYYIHGRSPHGTADVNMRQMTLALEKEEADLTSKRGLENGSNHQVFSISITSKLNREYIKVMQSLRQNKRIRKSRTHDDTSEKRMIAYTQLNRFLIAFIDNTLRDMGYSIVRRNFLEGLLDIEFRKPVKQGYFYADDSKCFGEAVFYGKERTLFIFDLSLFLVVDYLSQNYVLAAFVVYVVQHILSVFRSDLGKRNLSQKTLVDKRFLI